MAFHEGKACTRLSACLERLVDTSVGGFQPCEDDAVDDRNAQIAEVPILLHVRSGRSGRRVAGIGAGPPARGHSCRSARRVAFSLLRGGTAGPARQAKRSAPGFEGSRSWSTAPIRRTASPG